MLLCLISGRPGSIPSMAGLSSAATKSKVYVTVGGLLKRGLKGMVPVAWPCVRQVIGVRKAARTRRRALSRGKRLREDGIFTIQRN